ncbi:FmdB family transcriptional regulator [Dehalococcoides mccartyi]|uniref:zinc ribbon domain-containing protein n=1 Tax=Dehalococcoides mccartyi TaxID=61435 RepID=UPI00099DA9E2|nr:zinc ribbon domain-containing protein [Dehalococcoides mccartyi]AQX74499.1 FmdB family transcriptional regulator [Dehalococcoides mccartyi]AQY73077.1 FmdB family transcriptional regulator [Dehalococcoides mccartyi]
MPIYEYSCSKCNKVFEIMRPRSESSLSATCPICSAESTRIISDFTHGVAFSKDAPEMCKDSANEKMWISEQKVAENKIKDPDPLKKWREEREKSCGKGPEAWVEYAKQEEAKEQKVKDYGTGFTGREV